MFLEDFFLTNPTEDDGTSTFLGLTDTPSSYATHALEGIRVNAATNALEFYTITGTDEKVSVDSGATAGYLGAAYNDGVLRVNDTYFDYDDGGDFVTIDMDDTIKTKLGYIDQDVTSGSSPTFDGANFTGIPYDSLSDPWLAPPVEEFYDPSGGLPVAPSVGDRYIADGDGSGWTDGYIYEWNGATWDEYAPEEGWMVWILLDLLFYVFFSGGWMEVGDDSYLKLDQTSAQTILNDSPIFDILTASELVATDASKKLQSLAVATYPSLTELSYVKGVTSSIQTQLDALGLSEVNVETITGNVELVPGTDKRNQYINPGIADRTITLDTDAVSEGDWFYIENTDGVATSGYSLSVLPQGGAAFALLHPGAFGTFIYDGANWQLKDTFQNSINLGYSSEVIDDYGIAIGYNSLSNGASSVAIGRATEIPGFDYATALGYGATATQDYQMALGGTNLTEIRTSASIKMGEKAAAEADVAAFGQIWIKNDTPNTLWFTDDAGTDTQLGVGMTLLGYDENGTFASAPSATGDNAVAIGPGNTAAGVGSFAAGGLDNTVNSSYGFITGWSCSIHASAAYASVCGGYSNTITGGAAGSFIGGGRENSIDGSSDYQTIAGGYKNTASAVEATIGGGYQNIASANLSTVAGGQENEATAQYSSVCGGKDNDASGDYSFIGGGIGNIASAERTTISGGWLNTATAFGATVGGGRSNDATNSYSVVAGGYNGTASGVKSAVVGGEGNQAGGQGSTSMGYYNSAGGNYSTILGGLNNSSTEEYTLIFGNDVDSVTSYHAALFNNANPGKVTINMPDATAPTLPLQVNGTIAPGAANQDLGTAALKWDLYAGSIDVNSAYVLPIVDGAADQVIKTDGSGALSWTDMGSGDVTKVGTPVDNQIGVWTGDGTLEGTAGLTYDGTDFDVDGNIFVGGSNNELRFYEGANYVGFEAPALAADQIWILPDADGTDGQALVTDGAGNLSWDTFVGTMTSFTLDANTGTPQTIADGNTVTMTGSTGITTVVGDTGVVTFTTDDSAIVHDDLSGFVPNEHIDHTAVTLTAGVGLTGGGDISANRTFNVDVGIGDDDIVQIDSADIAAGRYGVFTANGLDGWTSAEVQTDLGLDNVTLASATITDNAIIRGDGGTRGVQDSGILIDDSDNITGVARITATNMTCTTAPSAGTDVVNKTYADGLETSVFWDTVRVASTANVVIASELENGDTIDGVTLATGDRVLLKDQTDASENGLYTVVASGAASRSTDADTAAEVENKKCIVLEGTANEHTFWFCTTESITLETTDIHFAEIEFSGAHNSLSGLQGGTTDEYYHLTSAQHTGLTTGAIDGLSGFDTNGIVVQTSTGNFTGRTITGTTNEITVADGDGVSGNPTISLPDSVYLGALGLIGRDGDNYISFATDNEIQFRTNGTTQGAFDSIGHLNIYQGNALRLNSTGGRYVGLDSNDGMATSYTIKLPDEGTAGQMLLATDLTSHVMTMEWKDDIIPKEIIIFDSDTSVTTGDEAGNLVWTVPAWMDGWGWDDVEAQVSTVSSSGNLTIDIYNITDSRDALDTDITVEVSEFSSETATTAPVINSADQTLTKGDRYRIDVDGAGTGAKGLTIAFKFLRK